MIPKPPNWGKAEFRKKEMTRISRKKSLISLIDKFAKEKERMKQQQQEEETRFALIYQRKLLLKNNGFDENHLDFISGVYVDIYNTINPELNAGVWLKRMFDSGKRYSLNLDLFCIFLKIFIEYTETLNQYLDTKFTISSYKKSPIDPLTLKEFEKKEKILLEGLTTSYMELLQQHSHFSSSASDQTVFETFYKFCDETIMQNKRISLNNKKSILEKIGDIFRSVKFNIHSPKYDPTLLFIEKTVK